MPTTFTYVPSYSSPVDTTLAVAEVRFGDGYRLRRRVGINNVTEKYNLLFDKLTDADLASIVSFLSAAKGVDYFLWTPPMAGHNTEKKFICTSFTDEALEYNVNKLTCTFEQVFDPT